MGVNLFSNEPHLMSSVNSNTPPSQHGQSCTEHGGHTIGEHRSLAQPWLPSAANQRLSKTLRS
ncbi:uncharacterized protein PHACADRAFT_250645 [Phanerochaete carnosa HHB-10118-sp]|uniref:Uncharacterized protein n=1 Tax=Phanerochaete carnosa (strain HHB-10118-sp) TaxID=650164 RepID=K5WKF8_PHACS|nr:uncharacterized protein PHACADRAFT_250645 [Phanerochaete carnosa HHB-10118-sp]EKM59870.1 hypothetical protein PHACADRAFT_250645 [Phanerochaete carnosa HHB-10118-sp]